MKGKFLIIAISLIAVCGVGSMLMQNAAYAKIMDSITALSLLSLFAFGTIELARVANTEIAEMESGPKKTSAYVLLNIVGSFGGTISLGLTVLFLVAEYQGTSMRHLYIHEKFYSYLPFMVGTTFYFSVRFFTRGKTLVKKGLYSIGTSVIPIKMIG